MVEGAERRRAMPGLYLNLNWNLNKMKIFIGIITLPD